MKSYEEMIAFIVKDITEGPSHLRYQKWVAYILLSEAYGKSQEDVSKDINYGIEVFEKALKEKRRAYNRASNEARRLANLAQKETN